MTSATKSLTWTEKLHLSILQEELNKLSNGSTLDGAEAFLVAATQHTPWQRDVIRSPEKRKALFGERRSGKTTLIAIAACYQCLLVPHSKVLYIGLTQGSVEKAMYDEILPKLIRNYNLPGKLVGGAMRWDNGSIIYLIGLDANKKQKERVRGAKSSLNILDECQSFDQDIRLILHDILGPATADTKASTILGGTAGNAGMALIAPAYGRETIGGEGDYWYEITRDNTKDNPIAPSKLHPEWMVYRCMWRNNTAIDDLTGRRICDNIAEHLAELETEHPGISLLPSHRQEWDAEWIVETSALIYKWSEANLITSSMCVDESGNRIPLPSTAFLASASYILGLDLGYNDSTAMVVLAFNAKWSNRVYVVESFHQAELLIPDVARKVSSLSKLYKFDHIVGDSSSLQVFETLRQTYGLPIEKANRAGKLSHQLVLNSDLQLRSIVFMPGNDDLCRQLATCIWDTKGLKEGKHIEDPRYKNDLTDAFLYAHHFSRHLWFEAPKEMRMLTNDDHKEHLMNQLIQRNIDNEDESSSEWSGDHEYYEQFGG